MGKAAGPPPDYRPELETAYVKCTSCGATRLPNKPCGYCQGESKK